MDRSGTSARLVDMNAPDPTRAVVGFLHPGAMGAELARTCTASERLWLDSGRSADTAARAESAGLTAVGSLDALAERTDLIVSICPPAAADAVAQSVAEIGFDGIYLDANAIAAERARSISARFGRFVDGGVIGPPPTASGATRMYLSGAAADVDRVGSLWAGSHLDVRVIGPEPGAASALKMAYAAWTKGSSALLMNIVALAEAEGLTDPLMEEWAISQPELVERVPRTAAGVGSKAWRWVGEMHEIASTFSQTGLPDGFHLASAEVYRRLAGLKGRSPDLDEVIELLGREH